MEKRYCPNTSSDVKLANCAVPWCHLAWQWLSLIFVWHDGIYYTWRYLLYLLVWHDGNCYTCFKLQQLLHILAWYDRDYYRYLTDMTITAIHIFDTMVTVTYLFNMTVTITLVCLTWQQLWHIPVWHNSIFSTYPSDMTAAVTHTWQKQLYLSMSDNAVKVTRTCLTWWLLHTSLM